MTPVSDRSFGLLIAYVIPGFSVVVLWGRQFPAVTGWLPENPHIAPTVGGFLYVTIASIAAGLTLSTLRWALLDGVHHATGLMPLARGDQKVPADIDLYRLIIDLHYRYYQFYGSSLLVITMLLVSPPAGTVAEALAAPANRFTLFAMAILFFAASRDTLAKCYHRTEFVSPHLPQINERSSTMTNGGHYAPSHSEAVIEKKTSTAPKSPKQLSPGEGAREAAPDVTVAIDSRAEIPKDKK